MAKGQTTTANILKKHQEQLLSEWTQELKAAGTDKDSRIQESELRLQMTEFISLLQGVAQSSDLNNTEAPEGKAIGHFLEEL